MNNIAKKTEAACLRRCYKENWKKPPQNLCKHYHAILASSFAYVFALDNDEIAKDLIVLSDVTLAKLAKLAFKASDRLFDMTVRGVRGLLNQKVRSPQNYTSEKYFF